MAVSEYVASLRKCVGNQLLLLPSVAAGIQDSEGRILLVKKRGDALWGFPGGAIEPGESVIDALTREVREEIGVEVIPEKLIGIYSDPAFAIAYPNKDQVQYITLFFQCALRDEQFNIIDKDEVEDVQYFDIQSLPLIRSCCIAKAQDLDRFSSLPFIR
jgi:ADP-ribose pyrophosphatase YjhB (NUDIX family)